MTRSITRILLAGLLAVAVAAPVTQAWAQGKSPEKKASPEKRQGVIPFRGKVAAIDLEAKTVKVGERTFVVTEDTRITKGGQRAKLEDGKVGEEIGGAYRQQDGKLVAVSIRFGPRPEADKEKAESGEGKAKRGKKAETPQ